MKFNLKIKARINISHNLYDKCFYFGYIYKFFDRKIDLYQTIYKFEIKAPNSSSLMWIMKEETNVKKF